MGCYWVIKMGVPVVIGVCQQSADGGNTSFFGLNSFTTVTVSYGTATNNQTSVPVEQRITTTLNSGNSFRIANDGLRSAYNEETVGIPLNHSFTPQIDGSNIVASELPADGACEVSYVFTFNPERYPVKIYDLEFATIKDTSPFTATFDGLNRSQFTGASSNLPAFISANDLSLIAPNPGDFAAPSLTVEIKILMGDGTFITQTQAINTDGGSIGPTVVDD